MFAPGETVAHVFIIPFIADEIEKVVLTYKQNDRIVFEKQITEGFEEVEAKTKTRFTFAFSQTESLLFEDSQPFTIQINVINKYGSRATSKEIKGQNGVQHIREVISRE